MRQSIVDRVLTKVEFDNENHCWNWIGAKNWLQYGVLYIKGKFYFAHRLSYMIFKGQIPNGLVLDHLCRNYSCINPDHLEAVTQGVNASRGTSFSAINKAKKYCPKGHLLEGDNLIKSDRDRGKRGCKKCLVNYNKQTKFRKTIIIDWEVI